MGGRQSIGLPRIFWLFPLDASAYMREDSPPCRANALTFPFLHLGSTFPQTKGSYPQFIHIFYAFIHIKWGVIHKGRGLYIPSPESKPNFERIECKFFSLIIKHLHKRLKNNILFFPHHLEIKYPSHTFDTSIATKGTWPCGLVLWCTKITPCW